MKTPQVYSGKLTKQWNIHHFDGIYQEFFPKIAMAMLAYRRVSSMSRFGPTLFQGAVPVEGRAQIVSQHLMWHCCSYFLCGTDDWWRHHPQEEAEAKPPTGLLGKLGGLCQNWLTSLHPNAILSRKTFQSSNAVWEAVFRACTRCFVPIHPPFFQKCAASMPRRARRQWHAQCRIRWSLWCGNSLPPKGAQESLISWGGWHWVVPVDSHDLTVVFFFLKTFQ